MDNNQQHIEEIIREKFEQFAQVPPTDVWEGIEKGLVPVKPSFISNYGKQMAAAAVILVAIFGAVWFFSPSGETITTQEDIVSESSTRTDNEIVEQEETHDQISKQEELTSGTENITEITEEQTTEITKATEPETEQISDESIVISTEEAVTKEMEPELTGQNIETDSDVTLSLLEPENIRFENFADNSLIQTTNEIQAIPTQASPAKRGSWSAGFYFSPEAMLNDFDSVELLPTYSFNFEPTYYINNHLFLRFGLGMSFSRDRGFAKVDYISNDYIGSYDDVYDVTFDSINGQPVPTYHTESVEIWDSIPHLSINQITNKYIYLQMPLLFGYHNNNHKLLRWYFYGGPAINFLVYKDIDEPSSQFEGVDIVNVVNELPERSPYYMQLWLGGGAEIRANKNLGIALEPSYRYYFNHVFKDEPYKTSLSGFSFRIGLTYKLN